MNKSPTSDNSLPPSSTIFDLGASNVTVLKALNDKPEPQPVGISQAKTIGLPGIDSIRRKTSPLGLPTVPAPSRQSTIVAGATSGKFSTECTVPFQSSLALCARADFCLLCVATT